MANIYDLTDTWDDAGVVWTALQVSVTNTASDADSKVFNFDVGGTDLCWLTPSGDLYLVEGQSIKWDDTSPGTLRGTLEFDTAARWNFNINGNATVTINKNTVTLRSANYFAWSPNPNSASVPDTVLGRADSGVVAIYAGDNNVDPLGGLQIGYLEAARAYTVATLPGTPAVGMIARVTDASSPTAGSTVTGGGAAAALVWYNGSNWTVLGV